MLYFFCFPGHPETDDDEEIEVDVNDDEDEEETSEIDDRESSPGPWQLFPSSTSCSAAVQGVRKGACSIRPPPPLGRALGRGSLPGPSPPLSKYKRHSKPSYHPTSSNTLRSSSRNSWQTRTTDPTGWGVGKWNATDASTVARHSHDLPISQGI